MAHKIVSILLVTLIIISGVLTGCQKQSTTTPSSTSATTTAVQTTTAATSASTTQQTTGTSVATATTTTTVMTTTTDNSTDIAVAGRLGKMLTDLVVVQDVFAKGFNQMTTAEVASASTANINSAKAFATDTLNIPDNLIVPNPKPPGAPHISNTNDIPAGFLGPIPANGAIDAPVGACPAGAKATVAFKTADGNIVTPALIAQKGIQTIPLEMVTLPNDDPGSLASTIQSLVSMNDQSLATAEGWNTKLWDKLKQLRTTPSSLMGYHIWTTAAAIEQQVATEYRQQLVSGGAPQIVLDAFDKSNKTGWYSSVPAGSQDALAEMQIEAVLSGTVNGTVYEKRSFSIPGLGSQPAYGVQTGYGTVTWEEPRLGVVHFSVDIHLDQYDAQGCAIGGYVDAVAQEDTKYEVHFTFKPDGSKEGVVTKDGETIGYLTMTVNHEKFENYIDVKEGTEIKLPELNTTSK